MKKVIGAIVLGMMMSTFAFSQQEAGHESREHRHHRKGQRELSPEERVDRRVSRLTEKIDLTEAQQVEVKTFHLELMKAGKASMADAETRQYRAEVRKAHRQLMDQKMESLLTEVQMEKYNEMKEARKGSQGDTKRHRKGRRG